LTLGDLVCGSEVAYTRIGNHRAGEEEALSQDILVDLDIHYARPSTDDFDSLEDNEDMIEVNGREDADEV